MSDDGMGDNYDEIPDLNHNLGMEQHPIKDKVVQDFEDPEKVRKRQEQALMFEKYLEETGLSLSFQIIFTEIIQKQIAEDQVFAYTAVRLRQIGKELENLDAANKK